LKKIDVRIALKSLNVISGVLESGKTSLVSDVLLKSFLNKVPTFCESISNIHKIKNAIWIDRNALVINQLSTFKLCDISTTTKFLQ